jgi:hypothetical protein
VPIEWNERCAGRSIRTPSTLGGRCYNSPASGQTMSDSLRTDRSRSLPGGSASDRDAKIEQLLLVGLDHYFAAQYHEAINVWTRALFLDRSHARARAYIDRARSALSEQQRASEELLQNGVAAFRRGDGEEARRLLSAAISGGAPSEEALAVLGRLERMEPASVPVKTRPDRGSAAATPTAHDERTPRRRGGVIAVLVLATVAAAALAILGWRGNIVSSWSAWREQKAAPSTAAAVREPAVPVPSRGEIALARGRALADTGRLQDALSVLSTIRPTDAQKPEADRLRANIQRQLLGIVAATLPSAPAGAQDAGRVP